VISGETGSGHAGDIAIDDLNIGAGTCPQPGTLELIVGSCSADILFQMLLFINACPSLIFYILVASYLLIVIISSVFFR